MSCPESGDGTSSRATAARARDGDGCTCSGPEATSILIDPEAYDLSEQRFAASLDAAPAEARSGERRRAHLQEEDWSAAAAVAGHAPMSMGAEQDRGNQYEGSGGVDQGAFWKQEVSSRLESYRARRRRPMRERSLPLDFERAVNRELAHVIASQQEEERRASVMEAAAEPVERFEAGTADEIDSGCEETSEAAAEAAEAVAAEQQAEQAAEELSESNVIPFPRQPLLPVSPPSFEELAETILDRPRILEVPEEVEAEAPLGDINVSPEAEQSPTIDFELPLVVASMSRRVIAALLDACMVMAGAAVFASVVARLGVPMPGDRAAVLLSLAVPGLFWAIYQYLFLVNAGTTPGMRAAGLRLITFDGGPPRRRWRRGRALALMLSTLSLGLGVIWALLDEDTLCWHDRITRTYLVS